MRLSAHLYIDFMTLILQLLYFRSASRVATAIDHRIIESAGSALLITAFAFYLRLTLLSARGIVFLSARRSLIYSLVQSVHVSHNLYVNLQYKVYNTIVDDIAAELWSNMHICSSAQPMNRESMNR